MLTVYFHVISRLASIPIVGGVLYWLFSPTTQVPDFLKPLQEFAESITEQVE